MLRPRIFDITKEEAVPSKAGTYKIVDLCSKAVPFLIEVKWIGRRGLWKRKVDEIHVDIQPPLFTKGLEAGRREAASALDSKC